MYVTSNMLGILKTKKLNNYMYYKYLHYVRGMMKRRESRNSGE